MTAGLRALLVAGAVATVALATGARAEPDAQTRGEIEHLFAYLAASECEFFRNGSWHDAEAAALHIRRKYEVLARRDRITTTESFIEGAASKSSTSGQSYRVRCDGAAEVDSAQWFLEELSRLRSAMRSDEQGAP